MIRGSRSVALLLLLGGLAACDAEDPPVGHDGLVDDAPEVDAELEIEVGDDVDELAALTPAAVRHVYGTSVEGQDLVYYKITPPAPNGKKAFLTFALHGFEDAWKQDGRALYAIARKAISYYGSNPSRLQGWTIYVVPTGNPDGMRRGTNNWRETAGAYGRCTSVGKDMNRHVSAGTSHEQRRLVALFDAVQPTIAIDFHGWYNTYYGNARIGGFFARSFNAAYEGKPAKYCFVDSAAAMNCGATLGGSFHSNPGISSDLFAEWATRARGVPAALVEYPAPDFNLNGLFDTVWDADLGYRRLGTTTLARMWGRTRVALDNLFVGY
ncbi:MAG: hypothetical protein H0T79_05100 [Deltaproteobacteria bacterium]|nr:hypothetical protein [Deltaproteobacteria bacterium]